MGTLSEVQVWTQVRSTTLIDICDTYSVDAAHASEVL